MNNQTQLGFVSLQSSNLELSKKFYTEVLGFKLLSKSPPDAYLFEEKGGAVFAIRKPLVDLNEAKKLGWGVSLWFEISDMGAFLHEIEDWATIIRGVQETPFGKTVIIADPDGYWLTIQEKIA